MLTQHAPIDFIAYNEDGSAVLLVEAKSRLGTSDTWAAKLRRNMLAHGVLPKAKYFIIATPDRIYGWDQEHLPATEVPPQFTADARRVLAPYFAKLNRDPSNIGPTAFDLLILSWLTDIARSRKYPSEFDAVLKPLSDAGVLSVLRKADIEMNPAG